MMDLDPTWLGAVLSKHSRDNSVVSVLSVMEETASEAGDNYSSSVFCATIKAVLGSGRMTTKKVFVKKALTTLSAELEEETGGGFLMEGIVYNNILSEYEFLINDYSLPYRELWPQYIYSSHNLFILEDLKTHGFKLGQRKTGLDAEHAELVLENLARMHSLSLVAVSKGYIFPKVLPDFFITGTLGQCLLKPALEALADVIRDFWETEWLVFEGKIRDMSENIVPTLLALYRQPHKTSVVNHGDCWVNNIMFKYNTKGSPVDIKFVDFQDSHYNSFAWDLSYFLYTSISPKVLAKHFNSLLEIYCLEFSSNLKSLGFDSSVAPTVQEANDEIIRLRPFVIAMACGYLPVIRNPSEINVTLDDIASKNMNFQLFLQSKELKNVMQEMLSYLIDSGIIENSVQKFGT